MRRALRHLEPEITTDGGELGSVTGNGRPEGDRKTSDIIAEQQTGVLDLSPTALDERGDDLGGRTDEDVDGIPHVKGKLDKRAIDVMRTGNDGELSFLVGADDGQ